MLFCRLSSRRCALFSLNFQRIAVHHLSYFDYISVTSVQYSAKALNTQNRGTAVAVPCKFVNLILHFRIFVAICNSKFTFFAVFGAFARFYLQIWRGCPLCLPAGRRYKAKNVKKPRKARLHTGNKHKQGQAARCKSARGEAKGAKKSKRLRVSLAFCFYSSKSTFWLICYNSVGQGLAIPDVLLCRDAPMGLEGYFGRAVARREREREGQALRAALGDRAVGVGVVLYAIYFNDAIALYRCGVGESKSHDVALTAGKRAGLHASIGELDNLAAICARDLYLDLVVKCTRCDRILARVLGGGKPSEGRRAQAGNAHKNADHRCCNKASKRVPEYHPQE